MTMRAEIRHESLDETFRRWKADLLDDRKPKGIDRVLSFEDKEDYWNAVASVFLHYHCSKAFRRFSSFDNPEADPLHGEKDYFFYQSLAENLSTESVAPSQWKGMDLRLVSAIKPKFRWPWVTHPVDDMGTVGFNPVSKEVFIVFGLTIPMEHLAFLTSLEHGSLFPRVTPDGEISLGQDGNIEKGNIVEFRFRLPGEVSSARSIFELTEALERYPEKVRIVVPKSFSSWKAMRKSYEETSIWSPVGQDNLLLLPTEEGRGRPFNPTRIPQVLSEVIRWDPVSSQVGSSLRADNLRQSV